VSFRGLNTRTHFVAQICSQTQGDHRAKTLLAASELKSQKELVPPKKHASKGRMVHVPMSLESCSVAIRSIAESASSAIEIGFSAMSVFDVHEAEMADQQDDENDEHLIALKTSSKLQLASPHTSFKLDLKLGSSDLLYQPNANIIPFRSALHAAIDLN
jgi:hypothetical protein